MNDLAHSTIAALLPYLPAIGTTGAQPAAEALNCLVLSAFEQIGRPELWAEYVADPADPDLVEWVLAAVLRNNPHLAAEIESAVGTLRMQAP